MLYQTNESIESMKWFYTFARTRAHGHDHDTKLFWEVGLRFELSPEKRILNLFSFLENLEQIIVRDKLLNTTLYLGPPRFYKGSKGI